MGATPSHEDDGDNVADPEDSDDDDDILKMQNGRYRVSCNRLSFPQQKIIDFDWRIYLFTRLHWATSSGQILCNELKSLWTCEVNRLFPIQFIICIYGNIHGDPQGWIDGLFKSAQLAWAMRFCVCCETCDRVLICSVPRVQTKKKRTKWKKN